MLILVVGYFIAIFYSVFSISTGENVIAGVIINGILMLITLTISVFLFLEGCKTTAGRIMGISFVGAILITYVVALICFLAFQSGVGLIIVCALGMFYPLAGPIIANDFSC